MIEHMQSGKIAIFNGARYVRDDRTGYYLCNAKGSERRRDRLHRAVWASVHGELPEGYHVHHIDGDKANNAIENLQLLPSIAHLRHHGETVSDERLEWMRENLDKRARPKAIEWHKSSEGAQWHKAHYEGMKDRMHVQRNFACEQCGKTYASENLKSRFCSNACKSAWRRASGVDNMTIQCEYCGRVFIANKYGKPRYCSVSCANRAHPRLPSLRKDRSDPQSRN